MKTMALLVFISAVLASHTFTRHTGHGNQIIASGSLTRTTYSSSHRSSKQESSHRNIMMSLSRAVLLLFLAVVVTAQDDRRPYDSVPEVNAVNSDTAPNYPDPCGLNVYEKWGDTTGSNVEATFTFEMEYAEASSSAVLLTNMNRELGAIIIGSIRPGCGSTSAILPENLSAIVGVDMTSPGYVLSVEEACSVSAAESSFACKVFTGGFTLYLTDVNRKLADYNAIKAVDVSNDQVEEAILDIVKGSIADVASKVDDIERLAYVDEPEYVDPDTEVEVGTNSVTGTDKEITSTAPNGRNHSAFAAGGVVLGVSAMVITAVARKYWTKRTHKEVPDSEDEDSDRATENIILDASSEDDAIEIIIDQI